MKAFDEAINSIGGDGVKKKLLYGRMSYMKETQDMLKPGSIGRSIADMKEDQEALGEFHQQVIVNKEDFEEIEQLLIIIGQDFIESMKHGAVNQLHGDEIQVLDQFSTRIYHDMARFALWSIYGRASAYNCLSFRMSPIYDFMADLHCFSTLSADRIDQLDAIMTEDLVQLASNWNQSRSAQTKIKLILGDTNYQSRLEALRQDEEPSLELDIDYKFILEKLGCS
ncbi:hypothetical protein BGZ49_007375 [Haplosporangium sp. Z 27]|nr:hypothetical protein BGZ49_007375 [Haplosporangium sp. Z 27]